MEKSTIYELTRRDIFDWRVELASGDGGDFLKKEREIEAKLQGECTEKGRKLIEALREAIEERMEKLFGGVDVKYLNLGIQIGMEVQSVISDCDDFKF